METISVLAESHSMENMGWLRAAVLGANDGILSTASLVIGVAAAQANFHTILLTGVAGLVAGAMSMAAGEYVSVSSQADSELADIKKEKEELAFDIEAEHEELAQIYVKRGLSEKLAREVSTQLMAHDALGAHAREELGITEALAARPVQAAIASAASFSVGGAFPLLIILLFRPTYLVATVSVASLFFLISLGILSAYVGGASLWKGAFRVGFWGALAMGITAVIGAYFGTPPL